MLNQKIIDEEIEFLCKTREKVEKQLTQSRKQVPEGSSLRAAWHRSSVQYYIRKKGKEKCGSYIKKKDRQLAERLAKIEFDEILLGIISDELKSLNKLCLFPDNNIYSAAIEKMNPLKRKLIGEVYISDEDYCEKWLGQDYIRMGFKEGASELYTKNGLRVRSKSEIIIAEILDRYEIPFLYEKPILFDSGVCVHPDFTILDITERKEIIWEHFGMMDDADYRNKAFLKIREYESNGYYQGVNFIWTMETGRLPINTKVLDVMVQRVFKG